MGENIARPYISLAGESIKPELNGVVASFTPEFQREIENKNICELGKDDETIITFPEPLRESFHSEFENLDLINHSVTYLFFIKDQEGKLTERLLVFKQLKVDEDILFTDPEPLKDWVELLQEEGEKDKESCSYKINGTNEFLNYKKWIVQTNEKYDLNGVKISEITPKQMHIKKDISEIEKRKILELNTIH